MCPVPLCAGASVGAPLAPGEREECSGGATVCRWVLVWLILRCTAAAMASPEKEAQVWSVGWEWAEHS